MRPASSDRKPASGRVKHVGLVLAFMGLAVVAIEVTTHLLQGSINRYFWAEIAAYAVILPMIGLLILRWLGRGENERVRTEQALDQFLGMVYELSSSPDINELVNRVVEFPAAILPITNTSLYLYNNDLEVYEAAGVWIDPQTNPPARVAVDCLPVCDPVKIAKMSGLCLLPVGSGQGEEHNRFCLPLALAGHPVGVIYMDLPLSHLPSEDQYHQFGHIAPELALAIDRARLQIANRSQAQIAEEERRHIAQDLHDTLGQNIAFLRLKLDQITYGDNPLQEIHQIMQELERMRTIADEAYQQVRETLADLHPENYKDFTRALLDQSRAIAERAEFELQFNQEGPPLALHPHVKRQILYICREAFSNIEKHARAQRVSITLDWNPRRVRVMILDDGVGFQQASVNTQTHYGLTIMEERAESISAFLEVKSKPGEGTRILLELPLDANGGPQGRSAVQDITIPIFTPRAKNTHENTHR